MSLRVIRLYPLYLLGSTVGLVRVRHRSRCLALRRREPLRARDRHDPRLGHRPLPADCPAWSLLLEMVASAAYGVLAKIGTSTMLVAINSASGLGLIALSLAQPDHTLDSAGLSDPCRAASSGLPSRFRPASSFGTSSIERRLAREPSQAGGVRVPHPVDDPCDPPGTARAIVRPVLELGAILVAFPVLVFAMLRYEPSGLALRMCATLGAISYPIYVLHEPLSRLVGGSSFGSQVSRAMERNRFPDGTRRRQRLDRSRLRSSGTRPFDGASQKLRRHGRPSAREALQAPRRPTPPASTRQPAAPSPRGGGR